MKLEPSFWIGKIEKDELELMLRKACPTLPEEYNVGDVGLEDDGSIFVMVSK